MGPSTSPPRLADGSHMPEVVLITGSSTGIGRATALRFARRGDRVYATMRDPDAAGRELREVGGAEELDLRTLHLDVTVDESVAQAVERVLDESDGIDVLVNNAGVGRLGTLEQSPLEWARWTFEVNVLGVLRMLRAVVPGMRERRSGTIVNVSSVSGRIASSVMGHYCASKWALEALSESLAQELYAFGVRVVVVEPGFVQTPILDKVTELPEGSEDGPYAHEVRRRLAMFERAREIADPPQDVAEVIVAALEDDQPRLRYLAGSTAPGAVRGRAGISDEEWIALGREMSGEEYRAEMRRIFGEG